MIPHNRVGVGLIPTLFLPNFYLAHWITRKHAFLNSDAARNLLPLIFGQGKGYAFHFLIAWQNGCQDIPSIIMAPFSSDGSLAFSFLFIFFYLSFVLTQSKGV